ncbi:MAG: general secretion pathway protein GspK, partial [Burkholderiales bacterium]|nr:general secretion pathway protein GspK [Burkholderiales bacterium]
ITILPHRTAINVNTTTSQVLSARLENASLTEAALMIAARDRAHFVDFEQFRNSFREKLHEEDRRNIDFKSNFFVVNGKVSLNQSVLKVSVLLERHAAHIVVLSALER